MLALTHVLDFFPPNFEEFKLFLISEAPRSSRRILVTSVSFSSFSCYWGYRNFRWFFQIVLHKASQGSKAHGLQLKGGNRFIRAPVLLACTTKEKARYWNYLNHALTSPVLQVYQKNPLFKEHPFAHHQRKCYHHPRKSFQGKTPAYCFCSGSTG